MAGQKQHVDFFRKARLRERLLRGVEPGNAYVPFIGDGDLAAELYAGWTIYGADLDLARVETAQSRLTGDIRAADCDSWPFADIDTTFHMGDFDAYADPYTSFKAFWMRANKADDLVLFFTDGLRQGVKRSGTWRAPDGHTRRGLDAKERRPIYNFYFRRYIKPWFEQYIEPYRLVKTKHYLRRDMLYWGASIRR